LFDIISESGVAAGVRRIEGVTGYGVLQKLHEAYGVVGELAKTLKTQNKDVIEKAASLVEELKESKREIESLKGKLAASSSDDLAGKAEIVGKINLIASRAEDELDMNSLRAMGDNLKQNVPNSLILLVSKAGNKINIVAMATKDVVEKGIHCGNIIKEITSIMGGGGGGKPDSAQGSGNDISKAPEAFARVKEMIANG